VEVSREKAKQPEQRFVVQVTLDSRGVLIRAQEKAESTNAAVDKVAEALTSRIRRYKGKLYDKGRGLSLARQEAVEGAEGAGEAEGPRAVVKNKNFIVKTMTEDEAIGQMELLGHDFFLFVSDASGKMNLLYRRKDGNYGLIEPQLG